jgi:hypothetical protein
MIQGERQGQKYVTPCLKYLHFLAFLFVFENNQAFYGPDYPPIFSVRRMASAISRMVLRLSIIVLRIL